MFGMARYARQTVADIPYHIINRGNNHQAIFFSTKDYQFFLRSVELAKEKYPCKIYSYVLMPNHIHLLLESIKEAENLTYFMKQISQRHAQYINRNCRRTGTLWEGRFKSSPVSSDHYLLACSRYIEMNPVRAGIVKTPKEFEFSSYRAKIGQKEIKWLDPKIDIDFKSSSILPFQGFLERQSLLYCLSPSLKRLDQSLSEQEVRI